MEKKFNKVDYILWSSIIIYTGIIYATLSIVTNIRKFLGEKYGQDVFDNIYWIFGLIAAVFLFYCFKRFKGRKLVYKLTTVVVFASIYSYYLSNLKYPIEKIHFFEYGLLGALIFTALIRHVKNWISIILSLNIVFWIGLGDETIQGLLVNRVGEIRDTVINLFSGGLAIILLYSFQDTSRKRFIYNLVYLKILIIFLGITTIATALFIYTIHGFGYCIEKRNLGRVYSSLSLDNIKKINNLSNEISKRDLTIYTDEAIRHLFQREFYFTNNYKGSNGKFYRDYQRCFFENHILEILFTRFLNENADMSSGTLIKDIDKEVAARVMNISVVWPDSLHGHVKKAAGISNNFFASRVKGTIITSFSLKDMLFHSSLIIIILFYTWVCIYNKNDIRFGSK